MYLVPVFRGSLGVLCDHIIPCCPTHTSFCQAVLLIQREMDTYTEYTPTVLSNVVWYQLRIFDFEFHLRPTTSKELILSLSIYLFTRAVCISRARDKNMDN
jgi:hypothetical protein